MQLLMSEAAHARVARELAAFAGRLDVVTMAADGALSRDGQALGEAPVNPELFWISLDMVGSGLLGDAFRRVLRGSRGRWLQTFNAGLDDPVFARVMAKGLRLTKSDAQATPIAEYVLAHAFSLLHPIAAQAEAQRAHDWRRIEFREIGSTRWLIVGLGSIGREIARRLQPFGAHLTVVRRRPAPDPLAADVRSTAELLSLLPAADVVILACPLTPQTQGMADEAFFAALKPGSILVNIGRGGLVDEDALRASLDRDRPGCAVLDVFQTEPLPPDAWFWDHPKVRVTAHDSNAGDGALARGDAAFLVNLRRYLAGEPLLNEAHPHEVGL